MSEIVSNFQETSSLIETHLGKALTVVCENVSIASYSKVFEAYTMIAQGRSMIDQFWTNMMLLLTSKIRSAVSSYCSQGVSTAGITASNLVGEHAQFKTMCQTIAADDYCVVFASMCEIACQTMTKYVMVENWHCKDLPEGESHGSLSTSVSSAQLSSVDMAATLINPKLLEDKFFNALVHRFEQSEHSDLNALAVRMKGAAKQARVVFLDEFRQLTRARYPDIYKQYDFLEPPQASTMRFEKCTQ
jgi:hypothetical protein